MWSRHSSDRELCEWLPFAAESHGGNRNAISVSAINGTLEKANTEIQSRHETLEETTMEVGWRGKQCRQAGRQAGQAEVSASKLYWSVRFSVLCQLHFTTTATNCSIPVGRESWRKSVYRRSVYYFGFFSHFLLDDRLKCAHGFYYF